MILLRILDAFWVLTFNLCRYTVGKEASILRELKQGDFDPKEKFWTRFPTEGSKLTPPHQSAEFRWKDYCPVVFRCGLFWMVWWGVLSVLGCLCFFFF